MEYMASKKKDGEEAPSWPVLYLDHRARSPFVPWDDKEKRRAAKSEKADEQKELQRRRRIKWVKKKEREMKWLESERAKEEEIVRMKEERERGMKGHDLRRSMSMVQLKRKTSMGAGMEGLDVGYDEGEVDMTESANASGYFASGAYMAASGNSVVITSTTGTTSTTFSTGGSFKGVAQLPANLRERIQQQIVTSRKVNPTAEEQSRLSRKGTMGPPEAIPQRQTLRKSKSTNTFKPPKREETTKPGYCENCREKFPNFADVRSSSTFAMHDTVALSIA